MTVCGICGSLAPGSGAEPLRARVERMCGTLRHRGPDDSGVFAAPGVALGATRLAIIDVEGGHQPVGNEDGTVWAVQNGEIYNYLQLRAELAAAGHRFTSRGDTEVLVHLYEEHGPAFLERLRGMFAIALWDGRAGRLLLARDRLGIKPLFYGVHDGALHFGSEIKALLATGFPRRLETAALHDYLSFDYVPGPRTMFQGIRKLGAGTVLEARAPDQARERAYWEFPPQPEPNAGVEPASGAQVRTELTRRLDEAVRASMISDVPVGAFLSGGLDSGVVVALMARASGRPVRTFTVGFRERSYDEMPQARRIARHFGTEHTEIVVEPRAEDVVHALVEAFDEPFADSSAMASWFVAQAAARHVKVVLSGDGGDEVFGGYVIYQADRLRHHYRRLPEWLTGRALPWLVDRLPASDRKMSWDLRAKRFVAHARSDPLAAHAGWRLIFTEEMKRSLYAPGFEAAAHDPVDALRRPFLAYPGADLLNRLLVVDAKVSMVDDMLVKVDRTSMAHGLEVRVPLLDHHLVEWMTTLPSAHKVRRLRLKAALRSVAAELLPPGAAARPKAGFHVPLPAWLKGELRPLLTRQLAPQRVRRQGVFDPRYVQQLLAEHLGGRRDHSRNLWGLLVFGLWHERHLDGGR